MRLMRSLLVRLGVQPPTAEDLAADLRARYAEPHRRYHTGEHIAEVLADVDWRLSAVTLAPETVGAVQLAVWYHDAIYDPTAGQGVNEDASAELAIASLQAAGAASPIVSEVARLVRLTADHEVDAIDLPGAVLVDADLSILASDPDRYDRYARDVRAEYEFVDDEAWRTGRAAVLRRFLDAASLYRVGPERAAREQAAKANLDTRAGDAHRSRDASFRRPGGRRRRPASRRRRTSSRGLTGSAPAATARGHQSSGRS